MISQVTELFGKPKALEVTVNNQVVMAYGELLPRRMKWDGVAR